MQDARMQECKVLRNIDLNARCKNARLQGFRLSKRRNG